MKIKLIAMDLDGTALQADHTSFTPRLDAALLEAHRRGTAVVPITGRQYAMLPDAVRAGPAWARLGVLCNGSEVRDLRSGEILASCYLEPSVILEALAIADRLELPVELSSGGRLHLTAVCLNALRALPINPYHMEVILPARGVLVPSLADFCKGAAQSFDKLNLPYIPTERREEAASALAALPLSCVWSGANSMEVTHRDATKANGMRTVCRMLGIEGAHTLAIGDSGNDISMLRAAGLGVAVANAPEEVRAAADAITAHNLEDGAALALERWVLHQ